ncbi:DUF4350 domain-containing protein [Novosphingobium album (ex Liu et al. 2023)]|uniref:ABC transporter n=1 Tax=Novosphingobium album (ex Liu et al. 2023) TaxID=3031130 RepID=A0ABT5WK10_9SPHN|nr:DUF4350 domain-containing protein [Novosphingobium album (ex Liu et al. 2023)]MDE8650387.1 ABC transporter [Novosphingobium album (ex Liu et al. 2023)]
MRSPARCSRSDRRSRPALCALIALAALAGCGRAQEARQPVTRPIGLYTSLPIAWHESARLSDLLDRAGEPHWALATIGRHGALRPLDTLDGPDGKLPLPPHALLILAQPRPLSPRENVALDDWVRAGGRVLLFADPMLTAPSIHPLGDPRRPQDVALLSPILARWGLELQFDETQAAGERTVPLARGALPVNLPGRFRAGSPDCVPEAGGLLAICRIGAGRVIAVADAALFESGDSPNLAARRAALDTLLARLAEPRAH